MFQLMMSGAINAADLRFIESKLHCGVWTRKIGADEMQWSRGLFELLDLDPEKDKPSFSLMRSMQHPDDRLTFAEANANLETGRPFERKYRVIRRSGVQRTLLHRGEVIVDASGRPDHAIAVVSDVSEQQDTWNQMVLQEKRISSVVKATGMIINIVNPDGFVIGLMGNQSEFKPEFDRRYGLSWQTLIHPEDFPESLRVYREAMETHKPGNREHRVKDRGGNYQWRRTSWSPIFNEDYTLREFISTSVNIDKERVLPATSAEISKLTGAQIRAARAIVNWSVRDLAEAVNCSPAIIRRLEEIDGRVPNTESLESIWFSLVKAGVNFIFPENGKPGVCPV